jgi:two-component system NarL family sensor kinase
MQVGRFILKKIPWANRLLPHLVKVIFVGGICLCLPLYASAQVTKADSSKVLHLFTEGEKFEFTNPEKAMAYYDSARQLATQIGFLRGQGTYAGYAIVVLNNQGKFREALALCQEALRIFETAGTQRDKAVAHINLGNEWQYLSDFELAAEHYLKAKSITEKIGDRPLLRVIINNLASIFNSLKQFDKGKQYASEALEIARDINSDYSVASSLINLAQAESNLNQYAEALAHFQEVEKIGVNISDTILTMDGWQGQADVQKVTQCTEEASILYKKIIQLAEQQQMPTYQMYSWMGLADCYLFMKRFGPAEEAIQNGIRIALETGSSFELLELYRQRSELAELRGNFAQALTYRKQFEVLKDSVAGEKAKESINLLEARFESQRKDDQIVQLEKEKATQQSIIRQKNRVTYLLIAVVLAVLLLMGLLYLSYAQRQRLQKQRIRELETEKQLMASQAVIKGQEEERGRLAKDLHDGLGGMLSGVKFSLSNMKSNMVLDADSALVFERSLDMLDHSISELRRVAHNMMPEVLVKFGLEEALKSYCDSVQQSGMLAVNFQTIGVYQRMPSEKEIIVYRIVQELVANVVKHSRARAVLVQLAWQPAILDLTVEDDGAGFDIAMLEYSRGAGWANIRSRAEFLRSKLDIQSSAGAGTSVHMTIPL